MADIDSMETVEQRSSNNRDNGSLAGLQAAYLEKERDYFECTRPEVMQFLPHDAKRVLDVGCGTGGFGEALRRGRGCEVWGIEPDEKAAKAAAERLDRAFTGFFTEELPLPRGYFDCIFFNDVLEHMVDPAAALELAGNLLVDGGAVITSVPNIRHFPTLWRLVMQGRWDYVERGILDKTHLRFFTKQTLRELFQNQSYVVEGMEGINAFADMVSGDTRMWKIYRLLSLLPTRRLEEMKYLQFVLVARHRKANP
jgi:SAM-dependent methyltransferase